MKILLTGNTGGIGSCIEEKLKQCGVDIVGINSKICDLSNVKNISYFLRDHECFDGMVHCAGVNPIKSYKDIKQEDFQKVFNINTFSFIKMCQDINFSDGSNIIAIGSLWATGTKEGRGQYSMTKHALYAAVKSLSLEMCDDNIKVNMISPGFVDTQMTRDNNSIETIKKINKYIPLGLTKPIEIAKMCEYLLKNNQSITGQNIIIDSGYSIKNI